MRRSTALCIFSALFLLFPVPRRSIADGPEELVIDHYGPRGGTGEEVRIRVDFSRPLIVPTDLSDGRRRAILSHFKIEPPMEGDFRFLSSRIVVFEPARALPLSSRYRVTLLEGLRSADEAVLSEPLTWSFSTPPVSIRIDPPGGSDHVILAPEVKIVSNAALDVPSLTRNMTFVRTMGNVPVPFTLREDADNIPLEEEYDTQGGTYIYHLLLEKNLERNSAYRIRVAPGVSTRRGNIPSSSGYLSLFRTYPPFRFSMLGDCGGCGPHLRTRPVVGFSSVPDWEGFRRLVTIEPEPAQWPFHPGDCDGKGSGVVLDDRLLRPATTYRLSLPPELQDVFGQKLENPRQVSFTTGSLTPTLLGPSGFRLMGPNSPPGFAVETAGVSTLEYRLLSLRPRDILVREDLKKLETVGLMLEKMAGGRRYRDVTLDENGRGRTYFDLRELYRGGEFGSVAYSLGSPEVDCSPSRLRLEGILSRTDLGLAAWFFPTGGRIRVSRFSDGSPVPEAMISIARTGDLPSVGEMPGRPCVAGTTDEAGILRLSGDEMRACTEVEIKARPPADTPSVPGGPGDIPGAQAEYLDEPPRLTIIAEKDEDWTFLQSSSYGHPSVWQLGLAADWEGRNPLPRGTIFPDRDMYRPGETVRMKGVTRYLQSGKMRRGEGVDYTITLFDPRGRREVLRSVTASEFGTFAFDVPTGPGQLPGTWQVVAQGAHRALRFSGTFRLAENREPEFLVELKADKSVAVAGETVRIDWAGRYFFGAPLKEASSRLDIVREEIPYVPKGREAFHFGVPPRFSDSRTSLSSRASSEKIPLVREGRASKELTLRPEELSRPMRYRLFVEVGGDSSPPVVSPEQVIFLPGRHLPGVKLDKSIVGKSEKVTAEVIVTDAGGKAVIGIPVTLKLLRRQWHGSRRVRRGERGVTDHESLFTEEESRTMRSGEEAKAFLFTPSSAGSFLLRAELAEEPDNGTAAVAPLWVAGDDYVPWRGGGEGRLEIIFDKKEYGIGEVATAFILSPFQKTDLSLILGRDRVFAEERFSFEGSGFLARFTVSEEMLPNAYLGASLVNRGVPLFPLNEEGGHLTEKSAFAPFHVEKKSRRLSVMVAHEIYKHLQEDELEVKVKVMDHVDSGHRSELTVLVTDDSAPTLDRYRPPDLVEAVYADRSPSVRVENNRPYSMNTSDPLQKGHEFGGGNEKSPAPGRHHPRLVHFIPDLVTDTEGEASFRLSLPRNRTAFRIMVVAVGEGDLFGYGEDTFSLSRPISLEAVFPRSTRVGDTFLAGARVTNRSGTDGQVDLKGEIITREGSLRFEDDNPWRAEREGAAIRDSDSTSLLVPLVSRRAGRSRLRFSAFFSGADDEERLQEIESIETDHIVMARRAGKNAIAVHEIVDEAVHSLNVKDHLGPETTGLEVTLASSALVGLGESAVTLAGSPPGSLEEEISRLFALMLLESLKEKYGLALEPGLPLAEGIESGLRRVLAMQNGDGGFTFRPTSFPSACWLSPYVARLFARVRQTDHMVPEESADRLKQYLLRVLGSPCGLAGSWREEAGFRLRVLSGLAWLGEMNQEWYEEYYTRRGELSIGARITLAALFERTPGWRERGAEILGEILSEGALTTGTERFEGYRELPPPWAFLSSPVITASEALELLLKIDPESERTEAIARAILNARVKGRWGNSYESARALDALVEYTQTREPGIPDFLATVTVSGHTLVQEAFSGFSTRVKRLRVPLSDLPHDLKEIKTSKHGQGLLYLSLALTREPHGLEPARNAGFAVKRTVRDWEKRKEVALFGEEAPPTARMDRGRVYEVELEFSVPLTSYHFALREALPAGLTVIGSSFETTGGNHKNPFNHMELQDSAVVLFADSLRPGRYHTRYLVRATTAGTFLWPGVRAYLPYEPDRYGTSAAGKVEVAVP